MFCSSSVSDGPENNLFIGLHRWDWTGDVIEDFKFNVAVLGSCSFMANTASSVFTYDQNGDGVHVIKSNDLLNKRNELCPDGKLHIRVLIYREQEQNIELMATVENLDGTFDIMMASDADVLIKTDDGTTFKAHKAILSGKSAVFHAMFNIDMEEAASKSVDIIDFKGPVMRELLRFIYFGHVKNIKDIDAELLQAAIVYQIEKLPESCVESMTARLNNDNVIEFVRLADLYDLELLFDHCCAHFVQ